MFRSLVIFLLSATSLSAAQCGGSFPQFITTLKQDARAQGYDAATVNAFFASAAIDPEVIRADRAQGIFQMPFLDFSKRLISKNRMDHGAKNLKKYAQVFDRIERDYGISRGY